MPGAYPPGLGNDQQASQATAAMRAEPWFQGLIKSWGLNPADTDSNGNLRVKLNETQRAQLMAEAIKHGIGFNDKYDMIDENGQIAEEHHKLKKVLIAAAIAGVTLTGLGAAGIGPLAGALGGTSAAAGGAGAAATTAGGVLPSTVIGTGFIPAIAGGAGMASGTAAAGGIAGAIGTGAKLASLASTVSNGLSRLSGDTTGNGVTPQGSAYAAEAGQLAANRAAQARVDQGGPSADAQALRNQFRAALAARMDPNATPLSLNGHALPSLANADTVAAASRLRDTLAARTAAGKTPTTFGIADPTQEELDAEAQARDAAGIGSGVNSTLSKVGGYLQTGSRMANLGKDVFGFGKQLASFF